MSNAQIIQEIFTYVCQNGTLVNQAQSAWGADRWELGLLSVQLEDDGYTQAVMGEHVHARSTNGREPQFSKGMVIDLQALHSALFEEDLP